MCWPEARERHVYTCKTTFFVDLKELSAFGNTYESCHNPKFGHLDQLLMMLRTSRGDSTVSPQLRSRRAFVATPPPLEGPTEELQNQGVEQPRNGRSSIKKARPCLYCERSFSKHEHLARHLRSHTKEKPFVCSVCNKRFGRNDTLLRHSRSHSHPQENRSVSSNANSIGGAEELIESPSSTQIQCPPADSCHDVFSSRENYSNTTYHNMNTADNVPSSGENINPGILQVSGIQEGLNIIESLNSGSRNRWDNIDVDTQPPLNHPSDVMDVSPEMLDFTDIDFNNLSSAWLVGDDFDLNALNSTIQESIEQYAYPRQPQVSNHSARFAPVSISNAQEELPTPSSILPKQNSDYISKSWFSNIQLDSGHPETRHGSPGPGSDHIDVDEAYRVELSSKLQVRPCDESLPTTGFLNLCIRAYFTRFNPIFPLLHAPTFRPSAKNSLLLLSICSVGSLFIGSPDAIKQGTGIFERLNKAILASWEHYLARGGCEALSMIQAAVIGQTFGLLSGNPWHLMMVDAFHGTVVAWARKSKMFLHRQAKSLPVHGSGSQDIAQAWRRWAKTEEIVRILVGLHIHDSEMACLFHHEPILRHNRERTIIACSSALFMAPNPDRWIAACQNETAQIPDVILNQNGELDGQRSLNTATVHGSFTEYAYLASIAARICESRMLGELDEQSRRQHENSLVQWYQAFRIKGDKSDPLCLMIMWHSTFMTLLADSDMLERAAGRDAPGISNDCTDQLNLWVSSLNAKRCIIHGLLAHKLVKEMQMGTEPAIHVPRTLFLAAITLFCYARYRRANLDDRGLYRAELLSLPDVRLLDTSGVMDIFEAKRSRSETLSLLEASTLCNITDLLQRVGHWEIARKYASTLEVVCQDGSPGKRRL